MEQERIRALELEKIRPKNETKAKTEAARAKTEAAMETERMRLRTEATMAELEAKEKAEKLKYEA